MANWKSDYTRYKDFFLNVRTAYSTKPNLQIYTELVLSLVTVVIFLVFAIRPTVLTIIDLNKDIKAKEDTLLKLRTKIDNLELANNLMQQEFENIEYIYQAVPKTSEPETLIRQIELLSNESQLKITGFSFSEVAVKNSKEDTSKLKNDISFNFSATGSYKDMISFLSKLESLRRAVKFDSFAINGNETENGRVLVLTINARVPFLMEKIEKSE